jgi:hypothetical protein
MSDTPRDFGQLSPASLAVQCAWEYADHVWLETLLKQRKEVLGRAAQRVMYEMDYMIEDGGYEITPQEIAEYMSWKKSYAVEEAGWDAQLLVSLPPFPWQPFFLLLHHELFRTDLNRPSSKATPRLQRRTQAIARKERRPASFLYSSSTLRSQSGVSRFRGNLLWKGKRESYARIASIEYSLSSGNRLSVDGIIIIATFLAKSLVSI